MKINKIVSVSVAALMVCPISILADSIEENDSVYGKTQYLSGVIVVSPKDNAPMRELPASVSLVSNVQMRDNQVTSLKGMAALVPNFYMPDYGSSLTSAVYIRGVGSRINTPAVGLYVDNVPFVDKSAFDFNFYDVDRVEVLRGPQSTLYGRNSMGGIVKVHTRNPFLSQGTTVNLGYTSVSDGCRLSANHSHAFSDALALSLSGYYEGSNGFFRNDYNGHHVDDMQAAGGRLRAVYLPMESLKFDFSASYDYSDEGAYPYYYTGVVKSDEQYPGCIGKITNNLNNSYRRRLFNTGLSTSYTFRNMKLTSVTAFQNISDRMFMDQDFISEDIYSLEQRQHISTLSEELMLSHSDCRWQWITGANIFYQWLGTQGPVNFRKDGVAWLNSTINSNANRFMPDVQAGPMTMSFLFKDNILGDNLLFDNDFKTPTLSAALYHQSTLNRLFGIDELSATFGLRLDYEHVKMNYRAWYDFSHEYSLGGHLSMTAPMPMQRDIDMVPAATYNISQTYTGKLSNDYLQVLPRLSLKYDFGGNNVYATISRGYRSGGYNVQNISELLRAGMTADMMQDVYHATMPVLNNQPQVPQETKEMIETVLLRMSSAETHPLAVEKACYYRPEYAWNFEVGTHLPMLADRLSLDASLFYNSVSDLQLSQMSTTGLGRETYNAGNSRSLGGELNINAQPIDNLVLNIAYGYTHATITSYSYTPVAVPGPEDQNTPAVQHIFNGNYVPFMPQHTLNADAAYTFHLCNKSNGILHLNDLTLGLNYSGVGKIYWNEANTRQQPYYSLLNARINLAFSRFDLTFWARNLTDTDYNTFWFESSSRGYEQHGKPFHFGLDLRLRL